MAEIETHKPISALPEETESLEGFYTVGYKEEGGEKVSKKVNLGFVQQAADSANEAASNANEKAGEAEQAKQDVLNAQETIEAAEQERASAETDRQASEQERQESEQTRSENETSRQTSETQRQESESARTEAEEARAEAEQERQEAETSRKQAERPYSRIDQVAGPMFDVTYPSLDYAYAKDYFENHAPQVNPAGCSALVKNGILVRSYDWKRKTADGKTICSFAVHTPAAQGHFAVVGMAGGLDALTEDVVEARQFSEAYKILPFYMQDGKNEKDLFAEMNVVPTWHNTRTVPAVEKRESISAIMLVRYILDNFQTVDEAVTYLQNYVEVYMPTNLDEMGFELHFLIADATKSVAIEFVENAIVAIETDKLTNFHLSGVTLNEDGSVYTNADVAEGNLPSSQGIENYGTGLERFNILNSATDPVEAIKAVVFSKAYTDLVNVWFSEFVGGDLTVNTRSDDPDLLARIAEYRQKWEDQDNDVWISVHQSIYRFGVAGLDVAIREGSDEHFVPISDHAQAQSDHSLAENDHSTAEDDHSQSTLDHAQSEEDHQTATQDHTQAGTDHEQAETDHTQAETDHSNAEEAIDACNEAKEAIEANETTRQTNEQSRQTAEQARSNAESARQTAEEARVQQAASDHTTAQSDHTQAGTDHTQAGQDHTTAQSDHSQATEDHDAAVEATEECTEAKEAIEANETERQAAEAARVTEEARRVAEYGGFEFDINQALNCIEGQNDLPTWTERTEEQGGGSDRAYAPGQYLLHPWTNPETHVTQGYVYRTTAAIAIGDEWDEDKVVMTSVFGELNELLSGDEETVHICLSSSDGELDVEGLSVQVTFDDGTSPLILTTDEDGICVARVAKGKVFTVSVAEQTGYQRVPVQKFKANWNERYVYMIYDKGASGFSSITITFSALGSAQGVTPFVGKNATLILSDGSTPSALVDSNGVASFTVRQGLTGYVLLPAISGFKTPSRISFETNFAVIGLNAEYEILTAGLYMVRDDGAEIDFYAWDDEDTCVAIHVATQTLLDQGADYYVDIATLDTGWFTSARNKQWATSNVNFPNVPTDVATDYDGPSNTANMLTDAADLGIQSPAAEFATQQVLSFAGKSANGYMGTKKQWQALIDNKGAVYDIVLKAGYTPAYYNKNIWTSTQLSATHAWIWHSGSWNYNLYKSSSLAVVPFFAI